MRIAPTLFAAALLAAVTVGAGLQSAAAPPAAPPLGAFHFTIEVPIAGPPAAVFDDFVGDVSSWWDHHLSPQPVELEIEPRVGGAFREVFDAAGNGCEHARVTLFDRGKALRLDGPLGLAGNAVQLVSTLEFVPGEPGHTTLRLTCEAAGHVEPGWNQAVEAVWRHFLEEQFKPHYEGGAAGR
ncbi:MAG TPA: SRPBCC domain-containing protein [Planctomycetota bacterium]|nr:SRPBCC domain-containing protein [Planctomycetota bacterium]